MQEKDTIRELCIQQGYVPPKCQLAGFIVFGLVNKGENPCNGCNADRSICNGGLKKY